MIAHIEQRYCGEEYHTNTGQASNWQLTFAYYMPTI